MRPFRSEAEVGQKGIRREVSRGRPQRIDIGHLDPAESSVSHSRELTLQLLASHRRPKPPPTHAGRRFRQGLSEPGAKIIDTHHLNLRITIEQ